MPGGSYQAIVVPPCAYMPETTLRALLDLAAAGAAVIFQDRLPGDVPGLGDLNSRRWTFETLLARLKFADDIPGVHQARVGAGRVLLTIDLEAALITAGVRRETLSNHPGLLFVRRRHDEGNLYFLTNQGAEALAGWVALSGPMRSAIIMDAMTGRTGVARIRTGGDGRPEILLHVSPGGSVILRTFAAREADGSAWPYFQPSGTPIGLIGSWNVEFVEGGPTLPESYQADSLHSWTEQGGDAERFAGTALYTVIFDAPSMDADDWRLDLGRVCDSARILLNGHEVGTVIAEPFSISLGPLAAGRNILEIEVTNLAANRIRDMDRQGIPWRIFREINFVDIHYKPFDASEWPLRESGLLGPVFLVPLMKS
jgi:hypothetical protein